MKCALILTVLIYELIRKTECICLANTRNLSVVINYVEGWYKPTVFNASFVEDCECLTEYSCIRICCDYNYDLSLTKDFECIYNKSIQYSIPIFTHGNVIIEHSVEKKYISGINKCLYINEGFYMMWPFDYFIQRDGRLWIPKFNTYYSQEQYCLWPAKGMLALVCIVDYDMQALVLSTRLTVIGMIISLPFLLVTFTVYAILPLKNLHAKSLMCYVFCLFVSYAMSVFIELYPDRYNLSPFACKTGAMVYLYIFESSVFWVNVMSIDIYLTFSGSRGFHGSRKTTQKRRFLWYSLYAWGGPSLIVILVLSLSYTVKPNKWYNPGITDQQCWLNEGIPTFIFFYLPMTILVLVNIILFARTACKIRQARQETAIIRRSNSRTSRNEEETLRFTVYLKLFLAMGINWAMDVLSWAVDWQVERVPPAIWYLTDFCNAAFGAFIFFIFVFKKSVWNALSDRCSALCKRKVQSSQSQELQIKESWAQGSTN